MNKFAERFANLMEQEGVSQLKMAKYLKISQQTVSKYMNNLAAPGYDILIKIAQYFEVTTDYLLGL